MFIYENTENFVGERLSDRAHIREIENNGTEQINTSQKALCLRSRSQLVARHFRQFDGDHRFVEGEIIAVHGILPVDWRRRPRPRIFPTPSSNKITS
jgi:hypothetical protein